MWERFFSIVRIALFLSFIPDNFSIYQYSLSYLKNHNAIQIKADIKCNILENNSFLSFFSSYLLPSNWCSRKFQSKIPICQGPHPLEKYVWSAQVSLLCVGYLANCSTPIIHVRLCFLRGLDTCYIRFRPPDIHAGTVCLLCIIY